MFSGELTFMSLSKTSKDISPTSKMSSRPLIFAPLTSKILLEGLHKTKSFDLRLQEVQKLVLESGIVVAKIMNMLYEAKQIQEASKLEVTKSGIRLCADTAMLMG